MTEYEKLALQEADKYKKEVEKELQKAVEQSNAAYAAELEEVRTEADDAIRREEETVLDTLDAAAVEEEITRQQVREAMANWGLSASGTEQAHLQSAHAVATRQGESAARRRDNAVKALTEALSRTEQEIETARANTESQMIRAAEDDVWEQENKLLAAAWKAEDAEEAKAQKEAEKAKKEAEKAEKEAEKAAEKQKRKAEQAAQKKLNTKEQNRRSALLQLLQADRIIPEIYGVALESGWSVQETLKKQRIWSEENSNLSEAALIYEDEGFDALMKHLRSKYALKDVYGYCEQLGIERDDVTAWYEKGGQ